MGKRSDYQKLLWPGLLAALALGLATWQAALFDLLGRGDAPEALRPVLGTLVYFSLGWLAARLIGFLLDRGASRHRQVPRLLKELIAAAFFFAALIASIMLFMGQSMAGALASSGILLAVLGFAVRNVVADTLSGIALGLEGPFRIGDWVEIDGMGSGKVIEIGWRTTRILTRDSAYMVLPNSQIARQRLINYSAPRPQFRAQIGLTLSHDLPVTEARVLLQEAAAAARTIQQNPAPDVRVTGQSVDGIQYALRYWVRRFDQEADCRDELFGLVDAALRRRVVAYPRRDLRIAPEDLQALRTAEDKPPLARAAAIG